jgi:hypothetical protein
VSHPAVGAPKMETEALAAISSTDALSGGSVSCEAGG